MRTAIEWVRLLTWGPIPKREKNIKRIQADALFHAATCIKNLYTHQQIIDALNEEGIKLRDEAIS